MNNIPFKLRDYQQITREKINQSLNKGENPVIVMDTGTGKTKTDTAIIADRVGLGKRIFVICPYKEVFDQWLIELAFLNPGYINKEGLKGKDRSIYVCMMMSLNNILSLIPEHLYPDEIHTDEAHVSECETNINIYDFFHKAQRLGMTATPLRLDNRPLGNHYDKIVSEINIKEAFENGFLTPFYYVGAKERLSLIPSDDEEIEDKKQAELLGDPIIIGQAVEEYEKYGGGKPFIVPCCTHQHAKDVGQQFKNAGWKADHLHGKLQDHKRDSIIAKARKEQVNIITTVGVGAVGLDVPPLCGIIWLRLTGSLTIWKQFNGRVLRLFKGKKWAFIIDLAGNAVLHGLPDKVYKWDINKGVIKEDDENKKMFQKCPDCGTTQSIENIQCFYCDADLTEEGKKEGTCRRCNHWSKGKCAIHETFAPIFCPVWLILEGCPSFKKRGRKLPRVVDGELVSVTTDGELFQLENDIKAKKEEIKQEMEKEKQERSKLEELPDFKKRKIISKGLFNNSARRSLFVEALEG